MLEVISVHIPKVAGTTFLQVLRDVYGQENVKRDYSDFPLSCGSLMNKNPDKWRKTARMEDIKTLTDSEFKVVHGHFVLYKYTSVFAQAKTITWLRHPVDRTISHYFHSKKRNDKLDIDKFIHDDYLINPMHRMLGTNDLSELYFVGVLEDFQNEIVRLAQLLRWNPKQYKRAVRLTANRNSQSRYKNFKISSELSNKILDLNRLDYEMYLSAVNLKERHHEKGI